MDLDKAALYYALLAECRTYLPARVFVRGLPRNTAIFARAAELDAIPVSVFGAYVVPAVA